MMGMCMLVVTLVIMIVWGRLCAILCTSAWLYFVPRFNKTTAHEGNDVVINNTQNSKEEDYLDSEVYKKRVVLEGLLERNHR
ncbi:Transmembrane protein [Senna tora]|uniref:Transmembrane protein n=1 Tax=Senna tora TaxID=362788 RepID=A0A834WRU0_9FABA|nr:Transmembrane protein [Senna tora]